MYKKTDKVLIIGGIVVVVYLICACVYSFVTIKDLPGVIEEEQFTNFDLACVAWFNFKFVLGLASCGGAFITLIFLYMLKLQNDIISINVKLEGGDKK